VDLVKLGETLVKLVKPELVDSVQHKPYDKRRAPVDQSSMGKVRQLAPVDLGIIGTGFLLIIPRLAQIWGRRVSFRGNYFNMTVW
jgi:hypothetical protein